jgi:hypothetical protein
MIVTGASRRRDFDPRRPLAAAVRLDQLPSDIYLKLDSSHRRAERVVDLDRYITL